MSGVPETCASLLRELRTSTWLPQYNEAAVQKALDEIAELREHTVQVTSLPSWDTYDPSWAAAIDADYAVYMRGRQCLLAHATCRLSKVLELRWAAAGALPEANRALLSPAEVAFADGYDLVLAAYMEAVGSGLDLTNGASPPKDLFVEVRVERDGGAVVLESGQALQLVAHERHLLRRADAEPLIRQGLVAHCTP